MPVSSGILGHQVEIGPLIGSAVLSYIKPIISYRAEPGSEASPTSLGSFSKFINELHPNTEKFIEGFKWDERTWSTLETDNTFSKVLKNWDPSISGISKNYFQSGIGSGRDLLLYNIIRVPSSGINQLGIREVWAPEINHGYYYNFSDRDYLYSDDSEINYVTYSGVVSGIGPITTAQSFNKITINNSKVGIPITVQQLKWNEQLGEYEVNIELRKRSNFTGSSGLSTFNEDKQQPIFSNIDQSLDEFIVIDSGLSVEIITSKNYVEEVGSTVIPPFGMEFLGISTGAQGQQFHLAYSPVDRTMPISVLSYLVNSGVLTSWEPVSFSMEIQSGVNQVKVDYDLGILEFGNPEMSGVFVPSAGHQLSATYWKSLKVEYEPEFTGNTVIATEASLNPIYRRSSRGFVYLRSKEDEPASITLRADLPEIQNNIYGPLFIGNNFAPLVATVLNSQGQPLEDQSVTFFITSNPPAGSFGTTTNNTISVTDFNGEARAFYIPPKGINEIGEFVTASGFEQVNNPTEPPSASGLAQITKLTTNKLLLEGTETVSGIYLYQVHVNDLVQGYLDFDVPQNLEEQKKEYYRNYFIEHGIFGPTGLTTASGLSGSGTTSSWLWEDTHRMVWNLLRPNIFDPSTGGGRKQLVAALDSTALNPHTFTLGAVAPVHPIDIESIGGTQYDIIYDSSVNEIPPPSGSFLIPTGTLYSYFVVAPTAVSIKASVFNNRLQQTLESNEISIKLRIPDYLTGEWIIDAINESHIEEISTLLTSIVANNQRVPLGWRLRSSRVTLAAALDGVTFLDVNKQFNSPSYDPETLSGISIGHQVTVSGII